MSIETATSSGSNKLFVVILDEFGHFGSYVGREHPKHRTSPVFGYGGIILPLGELRRFSTYMYKLKSFYFSQEIERSGIEKHSWEKKGASIFRTGTINRYPAIRELMFRIIREINLRGGYLFYYGFNKLPDFEPSVASQTRILADALRRVNGFCFQENASFICLLDDDQGIRRDLLAASAVAMWGFDRSHRLLAPPFFLNSKLDGAIQCADWVCAIYGRLFSYRSRPEEFEEFEWAERYFGERISNHSAREAGFYRRSLGKIKRMERLRRMQEDMDSIDEPFVPPRFLL